MICCLQPHIDLYSRFELNHVLVIVDSNPLDQLPDQSVVILRHLPADLDQSLFQLGQLFPHAFLLCIFQLKLVLLFPEPDDLSAKVIVNSSKTQS